MEDNDLPPIPYLHSRRPLASPTLQHPDASLACDAITIAAAVRGGARRTHHDRRRDLPHRYDEHTAWAQPRTRLCHPVNHRHGTPTSSGRSNSQDEFPSYASISGPEQVIIDSRLQQRDWSGGNVGQLARGSGSESSTTVSVGDDDTAGTAARSRCDWCATAKPQVTRSHHAFAEALRYPRCADGPCEGNGTPAPQREAPSVGEFGFRKRNRVLARLFTGYRVQRQSDVYIHPTGGPLRSCAWAWCCMQVHGRGQCNVEERRRHAAQIQ